MSVDTSVEAPSQLPVEQVAMDMNDVNSFMHSHFKLSPDQVLMTEAIHRLDYDFARHRLQTGAMRVVCHVLNNDPEATKKEITRDIDDVYRPFPELVLTALGAVADARRAKGGADSVVRWFTAPDVRSVFSDLKNVAA